MLSALGALTACTAGSDGPRLRARANEINVLVDSPPATLEPRQALDAQGQRLNMLMFRALTQLDHELVIRPDLASKWWTERSGKRWVFEIPDGDVNEEEIATCIREYLTGDNPSPLQGSFPSFQAISHEKNRIFIDLSSPDPFFPRNASLFRYYREDGVETPCQPVRSPEKVRASGRYEMRPFQKNPEREIVLHSRHDPEAPLLRFQVVRDETARLQKLLSGEADVAPNSFGASKWQWMKKKHSDDFQYLMSDGVNVSYLAFQIQDSILSRTPVRQAIAHALDIERITRFKFPEITYPAGSFLSSRIAGGVQTFRSHSLETSERLLDSAGLPRGKDGMRFRVRYKTTPSREGFDTALIIQEMLLKVGIRVDLEVVEPAVFFSSIRKGNFQMYSSRWVGVSDPSIFYRTLARESADNRLKYYNPEINAWLNQARQELDETKRNELVRRIQAKMAEEVPYYPLWFWTNNIVLRNGITGLNSEDLSLSGSYLPLQKMRWKR